MQPDFSDDALIRDYGVSRESLERLHAYDALLHKWQKAINIVSNSTLPESWVRHFVDSLQLLPYLPEQSVGMADEKICIADLGSGGGFPGMALAIARPDFDVHLIDSDFRKGQFLKNVSRETSTPVSVHTERVEQVLPSIKPDYITARGFAPLLDLFKGTEAVFESNPVLRFVLLKGRGAQDEVSAARALYDFNCTVHASVTQAESQVLCISNVRKIDLSA